MLHRNLLRMCSTLLLFVGSAKAWMSWSPSPGPLPDPCIAVQADKDATTMKWSLTCAGACSGSTCQSRSVTVGGSTVQACACDVSGIATACCQVAISNDGNGTPVKVGNCPACPASGRCIINDNGSTATAECDN